MTITWGYAGIRPATPIMAGYAELELDPLTNNIAIPFRIIKGPDAVVQRIRMRFGFFLGEWFLDRRKGIPYFRDVLVKNPDVGLITSIYRQVLLDTPGVSRVMKMDAELIRAERRLRASFEAQLEDPNVLVRSVNHDFILP